MTSKPRKRRTQTLAEKSADVKPVFWRAFLDSYSFTPSDKCRVIIIKLSEKWCMTADINGKHFVGERLTLEEAFKACANLLFKHAKEHWLRMDTRAVLAPWAHDLPEVI